MSILPCFSNLNLWILKSVVRWDLKKLEIPISFNLPMKLSYPKYMKDMLICIPHNSHPQGDFTTLWVQVGTMYKIQVNHQVHSTCWMLTCFPYMFTWMSSLRVIYSTYFPSSMHSIPIIFLTHCRNYYGLGVILLTLLIHLDSIATLPLL